MEKQIVHFSHWHYLILDQKKRKEGDQMTCNGCQNKISADFYGCKSTKCKHYVCKSCVGLAPEIRHPFHTKHPLTLFAHTPYEESRDPDHQPPYGHSVPYCNPCGMKCDGFLFHCSECQFDLHVYCATLMPTTTANNYKVSEQKTTPLCLLRSFSNKPHPLIPCYRKNKQLDFVCSVCKQHIKGTIYACLDCHAIMDESCIQLPHQITHHLHPQHTVTLEESYGDYAYNCKECNFRLDVRYASLMPKAIIENYDDQSLENHQVVQAPFTHPHDLIPCDNTKGIFSFSCSACGLCIEGTVYVCLQCNFLLHKSCAELPPQIKHPFHPPHSLVLDYENSSVNYQCKACKCSVLGFKYWCGECDFEMDVTCALLTYSTLKFEIHKHPLAIFNDPTFTKRKTDSLVNCNICENFKGFPFFRCVPCDFGIKLCCLTILPHKFKHSNHRHSLYLTYSLVKDHLDDDEDSEYYCDVCEELRNLWEPTYYCEDCHYVAHTSCMFHEILYLLGMEWPLALDEEIVILQAKVDSLTSKVDEIKERRANEYKIWLEKGDRNTAILDGKISMHEKEENALTNKLKTLTTKLDELEEGHPKHIGGYQIGSIPSLGTKSSMTILDISNEVVQEDCTVKSIKKDEDKDVGTKSYLTILGRSDVVVEECCSVKSTKKDEDEDEESDCTFSTLTKLDEEIVAIKIMIETLPAKLEALEKKRARCVSHLELK